MATNCPRTVMPIIGANFTSTPGSITSSASLSTSRSSRSRYGLPSAFQTVLPAVKTPPDNSVSPNDLFTKNGSFSPNRISCPLHRTKHTRNTVNTVRHLYFVSLNWLCLFCTPISLEHIIQLIRTETKVNSFHFILCPYKPLHLTRQTLNKYAMLWHTEFFLSAGTCIKYLFLFFYEIVLLFYLTKLYQNNWTKVGPFSDSENKLVAKTRATARPLNKVVWPVSYVKVPPPCLSSYLIVVVVESLLPSTIPR